MLYGPYNPAMAVTVQDIVAIPGLPLKLLCAHDQADRPIRWVHVSELEDPTPWLEGGEVILTTGLGIGTTPASHRAYVQRLADAGLTGLGFGLGFSHSKTPRALITAAGRAGFPLFEVPYPVPFIAITEAVFTRVAAEQYDSLQRAVDAEHVLTRAVMDGAGVDGIARSLAAVTTSWVLLLDLHGRTLASSGRGASARAERIWGELRARRPDGMSFSVSIVDRGHHVWVQPVGAQGRVEAFLAVGKPEPPSQLERIVAGHALSLFAIELAKSRAVAQAERRLQGDFFDDLASGTLSSAEVARGVSRFGFDPQCEVVALTIDVVGGSIEPELLGDAIAEELSRRGGGFLVSAHEEGVHVLMPSTPPPDLEGLARLGERRSLTVRIGAGSPVAPGDVAASLRESRFALQVCRIEGRSTAGFGDLGTYRLLLSMAEPGALRAFIEAVLAPIDAYDRGHGGDLLVSLTAFLRHNARWEPAAAELFVHRHTLRYRMRKVEELTGRDLASSFDRMELWIALRARELQEAGAAEA